MKTVFRTMALLLCLSGVSAQKVTQNIHPGWVDGQIYFKIKNTSSFNPSSAKEKVNRNDFYFLKGVLANFKITNLTKTFWISKDKTMLNTYLLEFSDYENVDRIISELQQCDEIEYAEKAVIGIPLYTPNDPMFNATQAWHLFKINAPNAWNYSLGDPNISIAIVDISFNFHQDLDANFWASSGEISNNAIDDNGNGLTDELYGWDIASSDNDVMEPTWSQHGDQVAGLASAVMDNGIDLASVGGNCKLMLMKCSPDGYFITYGAQGIIWATANGARVINMSWKISGPSATLQNAVTSAYNAGVVMTAAAGNSNTEISNLPAAYPEVLGVVATDTADVKCNFSDYSVDMDVSCPGMGLYTPISGTITTGPYFGTSYASPIVAGLAGLMLSLDSTLTPMQVMNCIKSTADNIDIQNPSYIGKLGTGRINAEAAMMCVAGTTTSVKNSFDNTLAPVVFPNPFSGSITISTKYEKVQDVKFIFRNALGETVLQSENKNTFGGKFSFDLSRQADGIYFVEVISGNKSTFHKVCLAR